MLGIQEFGLREKLTKSNYRCVRMPVEDYVALRRMYSHLNTELLCIPL